VTTYEAQAAIELEMIADANMSEIYGYNIENEQGGKGARGQEGEEARGQGGKSRRSRFAGFGIPSERALIIKVVENGELCYDLPDMEEIQYQAIQNLSHLPDNYKRIENADQYPVRKSSELEALRASVEDKISHDVR